MYSSVDIAEPRLTVALRLQTATNANSYSQYEWYT